MQRCVQCEGFIPNGITTCPNCSRAAPWQGVLNAVGAGVAAITLMACYGGPATPPQSGECKDYVSCYEKTGGTNGSLDSTYGTMGTCWSTTTAAADSCTSACKSANDAYKANGSAADAGCTFTK